MSFAKITKTGQSIFVDTGVYVAINGIIENTYGVDSMSQIELFTDRVRIYLNLTNEIWDITYDQTYTGDQLFIVESVEGVEPVSNKDLFDKMAALR